MPFLEKYQHNEACAGVVTYGRWLIQTQFTWKIFIFCVKFRIVFLQVQLALFQYSLCNSLMLGMWWMIALYKSLQYHLQDIFYWPLRWRHNERDSVSNHQPHGCLLKRLFRRRSKKTSKLRVTGLCKGNSPGTGEFPAQMASIAENVSIWWRHHEILVKIAWQLGHG